MKPDTPKVTLNLHEENILLMAKTLEMSSLP